jgi:hypothetical protein
MDIAWPSVPRNRHRVAQLTCTFTAIGLARAVFITADALHPQLEASAHIWP